MPTKADLSACRNESEPPLVAHVVFRLDVGGLENGLVNLVNNIPANRLRHAVICMQNYSDFFQRIRRPDVRLFALNKPEGNSARTLAKLYKLFYELRPNIVHTRNLGALEAQLPAALARVPVRIHGEHGWDVGDLDGSSLKPRLLRRLFKPFVHRYIAMSKHLELYLREKIAISPRRLAQIYNGVDVSLFRPGGRPPVSCEGFAGPDTFVIGTVGRMSCVKDQTTLARAFIELVRSVPDGGERIRLVMIGDGPLRAKALSLLNEAGMTRLAWLPGERHDIPEIMRGFHLFVLPSLAEGISNTILEAMASGLPIVATRVGGNPELVEEGLTGRLVPAADPLSLAAAMQSYYADRERCRAHGVNARRVAEQRFGLDIMVRRYLDIYEQMLDEKGGVAAAA
jgi:sugar transferase (PEP-CTERM/EpsH1 system associated)